MWWKSPAKKTTKSRRIADRAIMDYSRVRVKPRMCRDYPRAVLVQVAPTLCLLFIYPRPELDYSSVYRHHVYMISSFVRALISAFKARRQLVPADELNRRHRRLRTQELQPERLHPIPHRAVAFRQR